MTYRFTSGPTNPTNIRDELSQMKIEIEIRDVYGIRTIYPHCQTAKLLARLAGTKTITRHALETIKALGYQIEVKQAEVTI